MTKTKQPASASSSDHPGGCTCDTLVDSATLALSQSDDLLLELLRLQCTAMATQDRQLLVAAHQLAAARLGQSEAPRIIAKLSRLMDAIRIERAGAFGLLPACCAAVTRDEADIIGLIRACRSADPHRIERSAEQVASGTETQRLRAAAMSLALALSPPDQTPRDRLLQDFAAAPFMPGPWLH